MSATRESQHYTYGFSGVSERDTIVFKSIVGLLDGRTHGLWHYQDTGDTDMLVLGAPGAGKPVGSRSAKVVLSIGPPTVLGTLQTLSLHWPLRANEVFAQLEHVAIVLLNDHPRPAVSATVKLLRWPSTDLLRQNPQLIRLAALLSARPLTLYELAERSGVPAAQCQAFVTALLAERSARLDDVLPIPITEAHEPEAKGLFARIRAHLGIPATGLRLFH